MANGTGDTPAYQTERGTEILMLLSRPDALLAKPLY